MAAPRSPWRQAGGMGVQRRHALRAGRFWVVNHRKDPHFVYLRYRDDVNVSSAPEGAFTWGKQTILASAKLTAADALKNGPQQLRLTLLPAEKRSHYNVQVLWQSLVGGGVAGASHKRKHIEAWAGGGKAKGSVKLSDAEFEGYAPSDLCGSPAKDFGFLEPGLTSFAVWEKLKADTTYYYAVKTKGGLWSAVRNFTTPPRPSNSKSVKILLAADIGVHNNKDGTWGADGQGFTLFNALTNMVGNRTGPLVPTKGDVNVTSDIMLPISNLFYTIYTIGDFPYGGMQAGAYPVHTALNAKAASGEYHHAFLAGDLAYAEGMGPHWDFFLTQIEPLLSSVPTMFSNGNHESNGAGLPDSALPSQLEGSVPDGGGECGIVYERRLRMPYATGVDPVNRPEYYSYSVGPVAIVVLSTEQNWKEGSLQYNWLVKEFDKIAVLRNKKELPWLVVAFHRPMYVDDPNISKGEGNQWVALDLRKNLEPLFAKYQVDMTWTGHTHFYHRSCPVLKGGCVQGSDKFSAPIHIMVGNGGFQPGASVFETKPAWIDKEAFDYGYCDLEATKKELKMACFNADTGAKYDEVTLTKKSGWKPDQEAAEEYYKSVVPSNDLLPGVNITSDLQATLAIISSDKFYPFLIATSFLHESGYIDQTFGPGSVMNELMTSLPGTKLMTMKDIQPAYYWFADIFYKALPSLDGVWPVFEEIDFLLRINAPPNGTRPGGRLWQMLHP
ncbi:MAG: Metallo-dependent phosphatase-like protein [Monoraphidium minutum]|nr:MAG: Metallo-dependent phosphatase-like protein [Monoraphidium minutum]